jgi:hypothetical protein
VSCPRRAASRWPGGPGARAIGHCSTVTVAMMRSESSGLLLGSAYPSHRIRPAASRDAARARLAAATVGETKLFTTVGRRRLPSSSRAATVTSSWIADDHDLDAIKLGRTTHRDAPGRFRVATLRLSLPAFSPLHFGCSPHLPTTSRVSYDDLGLRPPFSLAMLLLRYSSVARRRPVTVTGVTLSTVVILVTLVSDLDLQG